MDPVMAPPGQTEVGTLPLDIARSLASVQSALEQVEQELRSAFQAAATKGDNTAIQAVLAELEAAAAGPRDSGASFKTRVQALAWQEIRRGLIGTLGLDPKPGQARGPVALATDKAVSAARRLPEEGLGAGTAQSPSVPKVYQETVRLHVKAGGRLRSAVRFLAEFRQHPELRLLQVARDPRRGDMDVLVGLRGPVDLKVTLAQMLEVQLVESPTDLKAAGGERVLTVQLHIGPEGPGEDAGPQGKPAGE